MDTYHQHTQLLNKFTIAQMVLSDSVTSTIRRELRKLFPDLNVEQNHVADILANEVLKREVIEGDKVKETQQKIKKTAAKIAKLAEKKASAADNANLSPVAEDEAVPAR